MKALIGRIHPADLIPTGAQQDTVSAEHATIEQTAEPGIWLLTDIGSSNGTFVKAQGQWVRLTPRVPVKVASDTILRFGFAETSIGELLRQRSPKQAKTTKQASPAKPSSSSGAEPGDYLRDPLTGKVRFIPARRR